MVDSESQTSGLQTLRPRARLLRTFGDELISSETVALIELVKNAYDADATRVLVRFDGPMEVGKGKIEVMDNGHGMSLETIKTTWMEPSTSFRKFNRRSEIFKRRVLGEKGIGRFSASKLAENLNVITRRNGDDLEVRVFFDWSQFDDENKYLEEVEVPWEEGEPRDISPDGSIQDLWENGENPDPGELTHGTILRMEGLRTTWDEKKFDTIRVGLSRLVSPMFKKDQAETNSDFQIRLELPGRFQVLSGLIKSPEALKSPNYIIRGDVDENGNYNLEATIMDLPAEILKRQFIFDDEHSPECGPFHIELRVWDRDRNSLAEIAKKYGSTMADLSRDLDAAAGISIYRDGFRLMPYGEPYNDWLRLDRRRVNNPTRNLSNNQIVGYVLISADKNQRLHEQSNREGLMEGAAFNDLRELVKMVLTEIEIRRYDIRHPKGKTPRSKTAGGLFTNFDLKPVRDQIIKQYPKDLKLLSLVDETEKDLGRRVIEVQEVLSRYRRLATLGQLIDTVLHEGRGPLAKIGIEAGLGIRDIDRNEVGKETLISYSKERFNTIKNQSNILSTVFDRIEPFGGRKRGRPSRISLEKVIKDAFSILNGKIIEVGSNVILPEGDTYVTADEAEIQQVIINLLDNSLYWLRLVPKDTRQILVKTKRKNPDEVEIIFSDSGPGVDPKFGDRIFEPYFSSKPDGMGLGLMIAGEIISDYYDGSLELLPEGPLSGATFRITLCRRV